MNGTTGVARSRIRRSHVAIVAVMALAALTAVVPARAEAVDKVNHFGVGAVAAYNRCTPQPTGDELCEDFVVYFGRFGDTRDGEPRTLPTVAYEHFTALIHPDGTATESAEVGFSDDVDGTYDRSRLTAAIMNGATLELFDLDLDSGELTPNGRTVVLGPFEWRAASEVHVFGNDGPFGFGLPRHFVDRCVTQVENAHQRFTAARVTGTINGVSVEAYGPSFLPWPGTGPDDAQGAIFDNRFTLVVATHTPECQGS